MRWIHFRILALRNAFRRPSEVFTVISFLLLITATCFWVRSFWVEDSIGFQQLLFNRSGSVVRSMNMGSSGREIVWTYSMIYQPMPNGVASFPDHTLFHWTRRPVSPSHPYPLGLYRPTTLLGQLGFGWVNEVFRNAGFIHRRVALMVPHVIVMVALVFLPVRCFLRFRRHRQR